MVHRVGRNELLSPASSTRSSPDPAITELLRSRAHNEFAFIDTENNAEIVGQDAIAEDEDEAELVLFAGPSNTSQTHKIRLSSPDAALGDPSFLKKKPKSYYFADKVTSEKQDELNAAAITGEDVLSLGKVPWPGSAVPWKVTSLTAAGMKKEVLVGHSPLTLATVEEKEHKRKRKGKKSRIALRKMMQAAKAREAAKAKLTVENAKLAAEKIEAEREKRTRRNREKKVKKKAREKAKKTGLGAAEEPSEDMEGVE